MEFFWQNGHLGWGLFGLLVYCAAWVLVLDFIWRTTRVRFVYLVSVCVVLFAGGLWVFQ